MDLQEYLTREGIADKSNEAPQYLRAALSAESEEEFMRIYEQLRMHTNRECVDAFYTFIATQGLDTRFEELLYQRTLREEPVVHAALPDAGHILDVGCGSGIKLIYHALCNPQNTFVGIDFCAAMLELAEKRAKKYGCTNVELKQSELSELHDPFDCVLAEHSLHELMQPTRNPYTRSIDYDCMFAEKLAHIKKIMHHKAIITLMFSEDVDLLDMTPCESFKNDAVANGLVVRVTQDLPFQLYAHENASTFFELEHV